MYLYECTRYLQNKLSIWKMLILSKAGWRSTLQLISAVRLEPNHDLRGNLLCSGKQKNSKQKTNDCDVKYTQGDRRRNRSVQSVDETIAPTVAPTIVKCSLSQATVASAVVTSVAPIKHVLILSSCRRNRCSAVFRNALLRY